MPIIIGTSGNDQLMGTSGDDLILGLDGNDFLFGSTGNDTLDGGAGTDRAFFTTATSGVTVDLTIVGPQPIGGGLGPDTLISIENITASNFDDTVIGDANNNNLIGLAGNDHLIGGPGNDSLVAGAGDDTLDGGAGTDTANYSDPAAVSGVTVDLTIAGPQVIGGGEGTDTLISIENITGSNFNDTLTGDGNNNLLIGLAGNDTIGGGAGDDTLNGGAGNDRLDGGPGNDTAGYVNATSGVTVDLRIAGPQSVGGAQGSDTLISIENLTGSNFDDGLTGDTNGNVLSGLGGNDTLDGGSGNDTLVGGDGNDVIDGGADHVTLVRASVDSSGNEAGSWSDSPALSADGRYVAFVSPAANLVPGDTNRQADVFVRDLVSGTTERVSVDSGGTESNGDSSAGAPSISADGRYVVFTSTATNLVAGDTNGTQDVFVHDRLLGTTQRVSVESNGVQADGASFEASISANGRYVVFASYATNLVPDDTNGTSDVFVRDLWTGTTQRVSVDAAGFERNTDSLDPSISADGRYVAFQIGGLGNLLPDDTNGTGDVYVRDMVSNTLERVSVDSTGAQSNAPSGATSISADGRYVAFGSFATNLVANDTNNQPDIFVHDRLTGATELVSVDSTGAQENAASFIGSISGDGRYVVFSTSASNLVPGDSNGAWDVFVRDLVLGTTSRLSVDAAGNQGNADSFNVSISADGHVVAFASDASNLINGDYNGQRDIFVARTQNNDSLIGGNGDDLLIGRSGNDFIDGGAGNDTAVYSGAWTDYTISLNGSAYTITDHRAGSPDGSDSVTNVELFQFANGTFAAADILNDPPAAVADAAAATEAGGHGNDIAGLDPSGNMLANDTDPDAALGDTKTVTSVSGDHGGGATTAFGDFGTLSFYASGNYTYALDNTNPTVEALNNGEHLTDVFSYTMSDAAGASSSATLTITINGADDAPTAPADVDGAAGGSVTENAANGTTVGITALSTDVDNATLSYSLLDDAGGRFAVNPTTGVVTVAKGALIDYETDTSHQITLQASDGTLATSQTFMIEVINVPGVTIAGANGNDVIDGTHTPAGQPFPTGEEDSINGGSGDDVISGLGGNDTLSGGLGNDTLHGGTGNDVLDGGAGNDVIDGGPGLDIMTGGLGNDRFVFKPGDFAGGPAFDEITDFRHANDKIDLSAIDAIDGGADNAFTFIGSSAFAHTAGQLHYVANGSGGVTVQGDTNGDGIADFNITLDHVVSMTATDFVL